MEKNESSSGAEDARSVGGTSVQSQQPSPMPASQVYQVAPFVVPQMVPMMPCSQTPSLYTGDGGSVAGYTTSGFTLIQGETNFLPDMDDYEASVEVIPEHACKYCGVYDPACVALCTTCNKWFCNSKGKTSGSHLVNHCVRSGHKEVVLHPNGPLGETHLECYNCGGRNIFMLGYIPAKSDYVVVMLCRQPCSHEVKNADWSPDEWKPLIHERVVLDWLLKVPTGYEVERSCQINIAQINRLEEAWKQDPTATLDDLDRDKYEIEPDRVLLRYEDAIQYKSIFNPLVSLEAIDDRRAKEELRCQVGRVKWEMSLNHRMSASFALPKFRDGNWKLMIGDDLRLKHYQTLNGIEWTAEGRVVKVPDNRSNEFTLEMYSLTKERVPTDERINYVCEYMWNSASFDRMFAALSKLEDDSEKVLSPYIFRKLMGQEVDDKLLKVKMPKKFSVPGLPHLNYSQKKAIKAALERPLALIQGPPGTGKTITACSLIYHLSKVTGKPVLVCAPSNIAVDQLSEKLHLTGIKVLRFCAKGREGISNSVSALTLHEQLKSTGGELGKMYQLKEETGGLSRADEDRFIRLRERKEKELLRQAQVICCTCLCAGDKRLRSTNFRTVVIDEITQATEPETMVCAVKGVEQLVLVGDHCQLGPVVMCKKAGSAGLSQSLFERLILLGNRPIRLQVQYRMHPALSVFPSNVFYEGCLQNGVSEAERKIEGVEWSWPVPDKPMMFWHCTGQEELSYSGTSYLNRQEAGNVEKLISLFLKSGFRAEQIGIVTPYEGQRAYIVNYMQQEGPLSKDLYLDVEVANVDAFQGREKDIIIVTCVRSSETQGIGFLRDPRRLNVALTRAKYGLILVGNAKVLSRQLLWHHLVASFHDDGCLVEGPLEDLKPAKISIGVPKPLTNEAMGGPFMTKQMFTLKEAKIGPYEEQEERGEDTTGDKAERRKKSRGKKGVEILQGPKPHMVAEMIPKPPSKDPGDYPPSESSQSTSG